MTLLAATPAEAQVVALKADGTMAVLSGHPDGGRALPAKLVIPAGRYAYGGRSYDLRGGAYRIGTGYRIVFDGAVRPFMSGIAWLTYHDVQGDMGRSPEELDQLAMHRRLGLSCGGVSRFAVYELARVGIDARRVALVTPYELTHATGHTVMEVYRHGWQVYDLDYNMRPLVDGRPVRGIDYVKASDRHLSFDFLSGDARRFDRLPYPYQMGTAMIEDGPNFFYTDPVGHTPAELTSFSNGWYRYLPRAEFMARFYP